jgi:putative transcriptional regulator
MPVLRTTGIFLAVVCTLWGQSKRPENLGTGRVLVMPRNVRDPIFSESVILLVRYEPDGAIGLMVNRRTAVPVARMLSDFKGAGSHQEPLFAGGPVTRTAVFGLIRADKAPADASPVSGNLYLITSRNALEKALKSKPSPNLRIFLGYCGWAPGQLESEARRGSWHIFSHSEDVAFDSEPATLWSRMVEKANFQLVRLLKPAF